MDPSLLKMASEQFAKMSPEQRAALQAQMANMDPNMSQQMFNQVRYARQLRDHMSPQSGAIMYRVLARLLTLAAVCCVVSPTLHVPRITGHDL